MLCVNPASQTIYLLGNKMSCEYCSHCNPPKYVTYFVLAKGLAGGYVQVGRKKIKVTKNDDYVMARVKNRPLFVKTVKKGLLDFKQYVPKSESERVTITPILNKDLHNK